MKTILFAFVSILLLSLVWCKGVSLFSKRFLIKKFKPITLKKKGNQLKKEQLKNGKCFLEFLLWKTLTKELDPAPSWLIYSHVQTGNGKQLFFSKNDLALFVSNLRL